MTHPIPAAALANHLAILGKTGSGKSYTAKGVVEQVLDAGGRVCIIDPTGVYWGLRWSADRKHAGYPVAIFGGPRGDFAIGAAHGEAIAEIVGTSSTAAILDTSQMSVRDRTAFFTAFADGLFRKNRGPLHLVVDEAHLFAPQGRVADPQSGAMLHAANNLVSLGRSRGLRIILISQRPAKLHKDSLTQVETLVALRLIAPQDRRAVEDWIEDNADEAKGREVIRSLATLKTGEGWVWAPEHGVLQRVRFPRISTFDSSAAPDEVDDGPPLPPIDRGAIAARLEAAAADLVANDPAKLKARIRELEGKLSKAAGLSPEDLGSARRAGYEDGYRAAKIEERGEWRGPIEAARDRLNALLEALDAPVPRPATVTVCPPGVNPATRKALGEVARAAAAEARAPAVDLTAGQRTVLTALIQYGPDGLTREQLTVLAGYKRSTRDLYLQQLSRAGLVETKGDRMVATDAGVAALPDAERLPTGPDLQRHWLSRLPGGERRVLEVLIAAYPAGLTRDELGDRAGYLRSTRDLYVQQLQRRQLVITERGHVRASDTLF